MHIYVESISNIPLQAFCEYRYIFHIVNGRIDSNLNYCNAKDYKIKIRTVKKKKYVLILLSKDHSNNVI